MFHEDLRGRHAQGELRSSAWQTGQAMYRPRSNRNKGDHNGRRSSAAPAGRTAYRRAQRVGRSPGLRYRTGFRPWDRPPQSRVLGRAAKQWEPTGQVVDDFPGPVPVLPGELTIIETYLARLLDESLEPGRLEVNSSGNETTDRDVEES